MSSIVEPRRPLTCDLFASNTLPAAERIRTTLIFDDYAGQDPINGYDLSGQLLNADVEPGTYSQITIKLGTNGGTDSITFIAVQTSLTSDVVITKHSFSSDAWTNGGDVRAGKKGKPQAQWVTAKNEGRPTPFNGNSGSGWSTKACAEGAAGAAVLAGATAPLVDWNPAAWVVAGVGVGGSCVWSGFVH